MNQTRVNVHQFSLETTSPEVDNLENPKSISLEFFPGKGMCKETTRTFNNKKKHYACTTVLYNTWNQSGVMDIICPAIRICQP